MINNTEITPSPNLPIYRLKCCFLPDSFLLMEITFIKKITSTMLLIFYREKWGDVFDITNELTVDSKPIIHLGTYNYSYVWGNIKDAFYFKDEDSGKDLLVSFTDYGQHILIYDLTQQVTNCKPLYVGDKFTLYHHVSENKRIFMKTSDDKLYEILNLSLKLAQDQYKSPDTRLIDVCLVECVSDYELNYIMCTDALGEYHDVVDETLNNILMRDTKSFDHETKKELLHAHFIDDGRITYEGLGKTCSFYYDYDVLYTGQGSWLCEWIPT